MSVENKLDTGAESGPLKLTFAELCEILEVDNPNDNRTEFLWNIMLKKKVVVTEELLNWCGYSGKYMDKKNTFKKLLMRIPNISYDEIVDPNDNYRYCIVLQQIDFEKALGRMRKSVLREFYFTVKDYFVKFLQYKNNKLKNDLKCTSETKESLRTALQDMTNTLRNEISPNISPASIHKSKERCLGLIQLVEGREWYLVRTQRKVFKSSIERVLNEHSEASPKLVNEWYDVSHSVDVANELKKNLRDMKWSANGNILKIADEEKSSSSDEFLIAKIDDILTNNRGYDLVLDAEKAIERSRSPSPIVIYRDGAGLTTDDKHEYTHSEEIVFN